MIGCAVDGDIPVVIQGNAFRDGGIVIREHAVNGSCGETNADACIDDKKQLQNSFTGKFLLFLHGVILRHYIAWYIGFLFL